MDGPATPLRHCRRCNRELPLEDFRPNPRLRSGYYPWCTACRMAMIESGSGEARRAYHREYRRLYYSRYYQQRITRHTRRWHIPGVGEMLVHRKDGRCTLQIEEGVGIPGASAWLRRELRVRGGLARDATLTYLRFVKAAAGVEERMGILVRDGKAFVRGYRREES